jgi:hypothetical protein
MLKTQELILSSRVVVCQERGLAKIKILRRNSDRNNST